MAIKKNDFVELEYTGRLKETNQVFDTTDENLAKESGIFSQRMSYGSVIICVGQSHIVKGLDKNLEGKEPGKYTFELSPDDAFGKKNAKLIQLIPTKKFFDQQIRPVPGLQINIDGVMGMVKTVSGGRTIVDFNHPLSGKELVYEVDIKRLVTDKKEQVNSLLKMHGIKDAEIKIEGSSANITLERELPAEFTKELFRKIEELTGLTKIDVLAKPKEKKEALKAPEPQQKV